MRRLDTFRMVCFPAAVALTHFQSNPPLNQPPVTGHRSPITIHQLPVTNHLSPFTHHPSFP
jgi:hypothetical protein